MKKQKVTISWSGGKDSAFALYKIMLSGEYDVVGLHTVIGEETKRVSLHGVADNMISLQAEALGLPLEFILLPASETHAPYEAIMKTYYTICKQRGIEGIVFGDIFLEDLKQYRETLLIDSGIRPVYPLWKIDSTMLINDFVNSGFKILICSANEKFFSQDQLGKTIDNEFINNLPMDVDVCGENGEFHTFVFDGPLFKKPVVYSRGSIVKKVYTYKKKNEDGSIENLESSFWFQDLVC
jgi:uncharacterized protein (TIGR00290 family)